MYTLSHVWPCLLYFAAVFSSYSLKNMQHKFLGLDCNFHVPLTNSVTFAIFMDSLNLQNNLLTLVFNYP
jgi:hypothetical protein